MFCISFSHKNNLTASRERFALLPEEQSRLLEEAKQEQTIDALVILMTCNRSEIYFEGTEAGYRFLEQFYQRIKHISGGDFRQSAMRYENRAAILHLYQVVCGLDSAVIGEVEIIRQVKAAYQAAKNANCTSGNVNIIFQSALNIAKDMANRSRMTRLPMSVGTLAQRVALDFCKKKQVPRVLVVGAGGEMGTVIRKNLLDSHEKLRMIGTTRKHEYTLKQMGMAEVGTGRMKWVDYDKRYDYLKWADVIISVTSSPHYTFIEDKVEAGLAGCEEEKLFLDLAVPRDIDEAIEGLPHCQLLNMDYIKELAKENNEKKQIEAKRIRPMLEDAVTELEKTLLLKAYMAQHFDQMEQLNTKKASWLLYQLRDRLTYFEFQSVMEALENIDVY